MVKLPTST